MSPHDFDDGCPYCEMHRFDDWIKVFFVFNVEDDTFYNTSGKLYFRHHFLNFTLHPTDDLPQIKNVMAHDPQVYGLSCYFYFKNPLSKEPETFEEFLRAVEEDRASKAP